MAYQTINSILQQAQPELSAAEAHGMATGLLCVNDHTTSNYWLTELLNETQPDDIEGITLLNNLFEESRRLLNSEDFDFELFLPDDESALSEQVIALKNWCQGFLLGIGSAHLAKECSPEAREVLKDITEFTKLDTDAEGAEDESAFVEVSEYLRAAVMLLKYEFYNDPDSTLH
ncbi:UPF0149 family protein [Methylosoma difficile]